MLQVHRNVNPNNPLVEDFRNFLYVVFHHLRPGCDPTPAQYKMAEFLQHGWSIYGEPIPEKKGRLDLIEAFRGIGKSEILATYCLWLLFRNPEEEKVLITSATQDKAKKFVKQLKEILLTLPVLTHLRPKPFQRNTFELFDVAGASNTQSPSVQAKGITGQITGDRATTIIADDIEIPDNSRTEEKRQLLSERTMEFTNIILPYNKKTKHPGGDVIFLGTPQSEESIYTVLVKERGYRAWVWPARYPTQDQSMHYVLQTKEGRSVDILCPEVRNVIEDNPKMAGQPTDTRFDDHELRKREAQGKANWSLQFMLDTSLTDEERFPLKIRDIMVFSAGPEKAPRLMQWGRDTDKRNFLRDIPNPGFSGDYWLGPLFKSDNTDWTTYDTKIMYVDTSGRGADETAWCVIGLLNGTFWVLGLDGLSAADARREQQSGAIEGRTDSYSTIMTKVARSAKAWGVDKIWVETNFGEGLWTRTFTPVLQKEWPGGCSVEEIRVSGQKEVRICDTLEPAFINHRVVFNERVARDEELGYQITHITRERNSLRRDDRVDCLAGGVGVLMEGLSVEQHQAVDAQLEELRDRELEAFMDAYYGYGKSRFMRLPKENMTSMKDWDDWEDSWSIRVDC